MVQPDNRLLTNLIKCEKEHHSALLALLVRSHTSLAALSAYASTAAPPVAQALLGCIQAFAAADEGLRGYAAAVEGWKEELKEVRRVEDEVKAVVRDKEILVGRLIKASKQKIPTSSLQAGPAPIPNASYLAPASPASSSFSLPSTSQPHGPGGYQYTPTPHATQHINSKLALAQRELHACEAHLAGKEAELAEVRRSALTEGMARRCRAMAEVGLVWRERGEQGMGALEELGREGAGAPPPPPHTYNPPHRRSASYSSHSSSLAPSHSASQYQRAQSPFGHQRSQSPFALPRSTSPFNNGPSTYQTLSGGYQHSHPLPSLPERDSWHGEMDRSRERPATYHQSSDERRPVSMAVDDRRPMSLHADDRRPISSLELRLPDTVELDIPPPHSIGDQHVEFIPLGRPVSSAGHAGAGGGSGSGPASRWGDDSSDEGDETFKVIENERWTGRRDEDDGEFEEEIDPEILRAVEKMGMVVPPKDKPKAARQPPTPPATASPTSSPAALPDLRIVEATPSKGESGKKAKAGDKSKRRSTKRREKDGNLLTARGAEVGAAMTASVAEEPRPVPTPTVSAPAPAPAARPVASRTAPVPAPTPIVVSEPDVPVAARDAPVTASSVTAPAPPPSSPRPVQQPVQPMQQPEPVVQSPPEPEPQDVVGSAALEKDDVIVTGSAVENADKVESCQPRGPDLDTDDLGSAFAATTDTEAAPPVAVAKPPVPDTAMATTTTAPPPAPVRVPTPVSTKPKTTKHRMTASASEPLVRDPARVISTSKRRTAGGVESAGETSGAERNKPTKKKSARAARQASAEERADLAAMLRDSDTPSPHVHFPPAGGLYVATAPPPPQQPGALFLPSTGGGGSTRSDLGPARTNHFDVVPPSPATSANRGRSGSGSTSFFGRVAGLFGRKKHPGDGFGSSGSSTWRTRTDAHVSRAQVGRDDSSSDEHTPGNLVSVTNVTTPAGRLAAIDNTPDSPKRGLGRKLTKADRGQTLRVGPSPGSPTRARKSSLTDREERFESASPGKKTKARKAQPQSVDGGGLSRKGSLKSTTSEPAGLASKASGSGAGGKGHAVASLMSLVEDSNTSAGLILPSSFPARRSDSPARSQAPQSLLTVPPARTVSPATTAAPRPIRATSPMPLKSALRNTTPSPMPHVASPTHTASPTVTSPTRVSPPTHFSSPTLAAPSPVIAPSPRNSMAESVYETGEEDFEDASDGEGDITTRAPAPAPAPKPAPVVAPTSHGTALAAFKDTISAPVSDTTASVSTTQPTRRKSVRINPAPPEMSATPSGTPAIELDEEAQWSRKEQIGGGGWKTRIGRGWEDSSEESGGDEEYENVRRALASSYKHMDAVNGSGNVKGKERERARR